MKNIDLIIQDRHFLELQNLLKREDGAEAAAYILFGKAEIKLDPWDRQARQRLLSHEVLQIPIRDHISADTSHITWSTDSFVRLLKSAQDRDLVPGIIHTHPTGPANFSEQDDNNESELARMTQNRNAEAGILWLRKTNSAAVFG